MIHLTILYMINTLLHDTDHNWLPQLLRQAKISITRSQFLEITPKDLHFDDSSYCELSGVRLKNLCIPYVFSYPLATCYLHREVQKHVLGTLRYDPSLVLLIS